MGLITNNLQVILVSHNFANVKGLTISLCTLFFFAKEEITLSFDFQARVKYLIMSIFNASFFSISCNSCAFFISLSSVVLIASFTNSAILNDRIALEGCVLFRDAPYFCCYFYHHINLRCRCHSNRQRKMNLINCLAVGYSWLTATNKELSVY